MKLELEIANKVVNLHLEKTDGKVTATIDGTNYQLEVISPAPNIYTLLLDNHIYELSIEHDLATSTNKVKIADKVFSTKVVDHRQRSSKSSSSASGIQAISAPMPGRVVQVLKNVGDEVNAGEGVVVVEAMKMQNELGSPKAGKVTAIKVKAGQTVVAGEVLAIIE